MYKNKTRRLLQNYEKQKNHKTKQNKHKISYLVVYVHILHFGVLLSQITEIRNSVNRKEWKSRKSTPQMKMRRNCKKSERRKNKEP